LNKAYEQGFEKLVEAIGWCQKHDIDELTVWALSTNNFKKRSGTEIQILFNLSQTYLRKYLPEMKTKNTVIKFYGEFDELQTALVQLFKSTEVQTAENTGLKINILYNYGGVQDLSKLRTGTLPTEKIPPIDLIIRTSGEQRLSGFLPWQSMNAELIFYPKLWGEITEKDFNKMMKEFKNRERRFGK
jgi:undecaprenyl pyrophosphate synthase